MIDLSAVYAEASGIAHDTASHESGLRAVEAAVRADQIEKDAAIAREPGRNKAGVAAAIRAQQTAPRGPYDHNKGATG